MKFKKKPAKYTLTLSEKELNEIKFGLYVALGELSKSIEGDYTKEEYDFLKAIYEGMLE